MCLSNFHRFSCRKILPLMHTTNEHLIISWRSNGEGSALDGCDGFRLCHYFGKYTWSLRHQAKFTFNELEHGLCLRLDKHIPLMGFLPTPSLPSLSSALALSLIYSVVSFYIDTHFGFVVVFLCNHLLFSHSMVSGAIFIYFFVSNALVKLKQTKKKWRRDKSKTKIFWWHCQIRDEKTSSNPNSKWNKRKWDIKQRTGFRKSNWNAGKSVEKKNENRSEIDPTLLLFVGAVNVCTSILWVIKQRFYIEIKWHGMKWMHWIDTLSISTS